MSRSRFLLLISAALVAAIAPPLRSATATPPPMPLGTVTVTSVQPKGCPDGFACSSFAVQCPGIRATVGGFLARAEARPPLRGVVAFFSGADGADFWSLGSDKGLAFLHDLQNYGLRVFQVRWDRPTWLTASSGEQVGAAKLACRPASVIKWIHDHNPVPPARPGACGFCISGQSAGASQVSYALARYGLDSIVSVAVPTSGPPHADIAEGCTAPPGAPGEFPPKSSGALMDLSYGYLNGGGPCERRDSSYSSHWRADGVDANGSFFYPSTHVQFIFGDADTNPADYHAQKYVNQLRAAHSPYVSVDVIHCMEHGVQNSDDGLAALKAALLGQPEPRPTSTAQCSGKNVSGQGAVSSKRSKSRQEAATAAASIAPRSGSARSWLIPLAVGLAAFVLGALTRRIRRRGVSLPS